MKKVININFQGRIIPIEETAFDMLQQYIESLRQYFIHEEGRDEIINDIESRISELFAEVLHKGQPCITAQDVNAIISSIGRPEDLETEESEKFSNTSSQEHQSASQEQEPSPKRLYRDEDDKILGGVCAGIANYFRIDPAIIRIVFALITFGGWGLGFLFYILLWIILPSQSLEKDFNRKRLFRNSDDRIIAGVASGIAAYFHIDVWIPRLIFAFPILAGIAISIIHNLFGNFDYFPSVFFGSFGTTSCLVYVLLWIVIPQAKTATEKKEMRGDKIDLNSIKNTVQQDLNSLKGRVENWGKEVNETAKGWQQQKSTKPERKKQCNSIAQIIGTLFKAFFLFIAGILALCILAGVIALVFGSIHLWPVQNFFVHNVWGSIFLWTTLFLLIGVPIIHLFVWIVRRIANLPRRKYIPYLFIGLWTLGFISLVFLVSFVSKDFKMKSAVTDSVNIQQPSVKKLIIKAQPSYALPFEENWLGLHIDDDEAPFFFSLISDDSAALRTLSLRIIQSADSAYHARIVKLSRGATMRQARSHASNIAYSITQNDSIIQLPDAFIITSQNGFFNQQVELVIEVPVSGKIELDRSLKNYKWLNYHLVENDEGETEYDSDIEIDEWDGNKEYEMTANGLKMISLKPASKTNIEKEEKNEKKYRYEKSEARKETKSLTLPSFKDDALPVSISSMLFQRMLQ